ncbi:hypothetical protein H8D57_01295, partial [bacterium]|nr:hypothetical protein [bacterium]
LLEPQTSDAIQEGGKRPSSWLSFEKGLFSESSHILLEEHFWHEDSQSATTRFFVLDTGSGDVEAYALTNEAYTAIKLDQLLIDMGFSRIKRLPSLAGSEEYRQEGLFVVMGRKE